MKNLNTRLHRDLSMSVVNRYCDKNTKRRYLKKNKFMIILKALHFLFIYVNGNWISIILLYV